MRKLQMLMVAAALSVVAMGTSGCCAKKCKGDKGGFDAAIGRVEGAANKAEDAANRAAAAAKSATSAANRAEEAAKRSGRMDAKGMYK